MQTLRHTLRLTLPLAAALLFVPTFSGCSSLSSTGSGALIGAGAGSVIGAIIGRSTGNTAAGAVVGAAVGGTAGAIIGNQMDKQREELESEIDNAEIEPIVGADGQTAGIQIIFNNAILFDVNSSSLKAQSQTDLASLARSMQSYPNHDAVIVGHASSDGADDYNMSLSERRAQAVSAYLATQGVPAARLQTLGKGETQPVADNSTPEGRAANRRVEIALYANPNYQQQVQQQSGGN